ncbi:glucoamylase family protein [Changchengzhania lutea]|uniref:glucoamylase family protein n=1 Tax=Changchengzhania lutea TaxID=2049305 RepID=UPI00115C7468|nr:glucoamylase family protein [Changchengzhania lutea]
MKSVLAIKTNRMLKTFIYGLTIFTVLFGCNNPNGIAPPPPDVGFIGEPVPVIPFEELLDLVQERTFKYFWDFADPTSGLARERSQSLETLTTGGSGFGISSFPAAINRGWISKDEAIQQLKKILTFLENADTYHGVFSHWYLNTGTTQPFGNKDDGGDIVETAFLIQGLLINRQYFSGNSADEIDIRDRITAIWEDVEWDWYTQGNKSITWHWSTNYEFELNHIISGWNEALIVYVLAASSPTHPIDKETYDNGWARNGDIKNEGTFYGHFLPLGENLGGPLFFAHYSFIGLDPRGLEDQYANYFEQNQAHSLINYEYCIANPKGYAGYSGHSWGLTASDNNTGYAAHSPTNDLGIITPTAALSSFPYTPNESKKALEYFYYNLNQNLWGDYGFYDAFSEHFNWYADGYLAIDQGPIVAMIENYRSQLLWTLFMQDQEIKDGLTKLGFTY